MRVVGAEVVSTAVFLVFLYAVARYEVIHLLAALRVADRSTMIGKEKIEAKAAEVDIHV